MAWTKRAISHTDVPKELPERIVAVKNNIVNVLENADIGFEGVDVYLAGSPAMVHAVIDLLTSRGVGLEHIHVDSFGQ